MRNLKSILYFSASIFLGQAFLLSLPAGARLSYEERAEQFDAQHGEGAYDDYVSNMQEAREERRQAQLEMIQAQREGMQAQLDSIYGEGFFDPPRRSKDTDHADRKDKGSLSNDDASSLAEMRERYGAITSTDKAE